MNRKKQKGFVTLLMLMLLGAKGTFAVENSVNEKKDEKKATSVEEKSIPESSSKTLFGSLPEKTGSGGGLFMLYRFSQFNPADDGIPHIIGGRGYGQFGRYLRFGGFAILGTGIPGDHSSRSFSVYGGPYLQFTLPFDPVILAIGSNFGLGMDFDVPARIDYMLYPHVEVEVRLFENLSLSVGAGFLKTRTSITLPELAQYNVTFAINLTRFSTGKNENKAPGLPELPNL